MSVTESPEVKAPVEHAFDHLHKVLTAVIDRIPWHSEQQHEDVLGSLRQSELAIKGDDIDASPAVVPPAVFRPGPVNPFDAAVAAAGPQPAVIDYEKLAAAIVTAQAKATAAQAAAESPAASDSAPAGSEGEAAPTSSEPASNLPQV